MMLALAADQLVVPNSPQSLPAGTPACDPELARKRGVLFARVATGVYNAERAIAAGVARQNASAFMRLATDSRDLGKTEGLIEACQPTTLKVPQLQAALANTRRDLVLLEARLGAAWLDQQYAQWMVLRASVQKFHRFVARNQVWLARAQAAAAAQPVKVGVFTPPAYLDDEEPSDPATVEPPPGMETVVEPIEPKPPLHKRGWFWGALAAGAAAVAGAVLLSR